MNQLNTTGLAPVNAAADYGVPDDPSRLLVLRQGDAGCGVDAILAGLRQDQVVLVQNASAQDADNLLYGVAERLDLQNQLKVQSAFASIHGHRENVGKYFMSVNKRTDYQFIPAHSEGQHASNLQLASLYCYENSTDGGETILLNTDSDSPMWDILGEIVTKVDLCGRKLSPSEIAGAKMMFKINIPEDVLSADDKVLREQKAPVPGIKVFDALTRSKKARSRILERELNVYWDTVASLDFDSGKEYMRLLQSCGLLRQPAGGMDIAKLDNAHIRRVWSSGVNYESLFRARLVRKLVPGDLVIQNNLTWTHSTANWTPGSGTRKVVAAFA